MKAQIIASNVMLIHRETNLLQCYAYHVMLTDKHNNEVNWFLSKHNI